MQVSPLRHPSPNPISFGILKGYKQTPYGSYMWGEYKNYKIDVYDAKDKYNQKLIYLSNKGTLRWIKSKLIYLNRGIAKIIRSESK